MLTKNKYTDENLLLPKEIEDVIENSKIEWTKSKEDIWLQMESKLEQTAPKVIKMRTNVFPQIMKYAAVASVVLVIAFSATAALYTKKINTGLTAQSLLLPDNSKVDVHANSTFSYKPLLWKLSRMVKLEGEAYFNVEQGQKFAVISEKGKAVVLGTRFTVTARNNEYSVNCEQGKVLVIANSNKNEVTINAGESAFLQANNQFKVANKTSEKIEEVNANSSKTETNNDNETQENNKSEIEPKKTEETHQEQNQYKEPVKPDVQRGNAPENKVENAMDEAKSILNEAEPKQQAVKQQEKSTVQQPQKQPESTNAETAKIRFKNSLTKKQIEILEDTKMSKEEKQKAFLKTLTDEQKALLNQQSKDAVSGNVNDNNKNAVKDNIKQEQKNQSKSQMDNSPAKSSGTPINGGGKGK